MKHEVSIYDARNQLSKLIAFAEQGETVIITKNNLPVIKLLYIGPRKRPVYGLNAGSFPPVGPEAFAPLSDEETREFYGE
ncbi:MAG TPA: type II toxin-antitoxin system prevent-host-death family antitoxin [Acetobacteraceae bacterium]|nr:type II toxin-antitoxin system prevent-host-death family antitoxin [Acetobacteraceae bacterium]